ncbi:hypothetical protein [Reyranella sp.]|uniref:hypothetical protein n=1 Tax=Reyranella sp. TaxID=1929291 RepID=UPI003BAD38A3
MRLDFPAFGTGLALSFALVTGGAALAQNDEFVKVCMATTPQKTCECISSKIPADKRQDALEGLRRSNKAMEPGGNLLDPSNLTQAQMLGLDAVVLAQADCTD